MIHKHSRSKVAPAHPVHILPLEEIITSRSPGMSVVLTKAKDPPILKEYHPICNLFTIP